MSDELLDRKSIFSVFTECKASLARVVRRHSNRHNDVEDILQEAFLNVYSVDKSNPITFPKQYLFKATKNLAVRENSRVSEKLTEFIEDSADDLILTDSADIFAGLAAEQEKALLFEAIEKLPEQCRKVTKLRIFEGAKLNAIANELGIAVSTVEKHLAKGLDSCDDYVRKTLRTLPENMATSPDNQRQQRNIK